MTDIYNHPQEFRFISGRDTMQDRQPEKDKLKAQLDELDAEVDKLKARAKQAGAEQRMKYSEYVDTLEEKRSDMKKRFEELKDDTGEALDELKAGVKDAWERLAIAKRAAQAEMRS